MRKIENPEVKEKRQRLIQIVLAVAIIGLMVSSTIGFALVFHNPNSGNTNDNNIDVNEYNGVEFSQSGGFWQANINNNVVVTRHHPEETESLINFESSVSDFSGKPLYFVIGNLSGVAAQEVIQNIASYGSRYQEACLENLKCDDNNFVVKTCSDNIIVINIGEEIKAYKQENCIFLEAPETDLILLSDAFVFKALDIQ